MTHDVKNASDLYEDFHRYPPKDIGEFDPDFEIPSHVYKQGRAVDVLYRSLKTDPETLKRPRKPVNYIHDHDSKGVVVHLAPGGESESMSFKARDVAAGRLRYDDVVETPDWIRSATALTMLGQCIGFSFEGRDGEPVQAKGQRPLPELYAVQTGGWSPKAALLVIQDKREVIAIIWGGKLRVEPRGIVG